MSTLKTNRLSWLDILRAAAVLLVILHHLGYRFPPPSSDIVALLIRRIGWVGVDIFFVLSGFLIAKVVYHSSDSPITFLTKRFFRITPAYYLAISLLILFSCMGFGGENLALVWIPLLMLSGFYIPFSPENQVPFEILWSISVEVVFYFIVFFLMHVGRRCFFVIMVLMIFLQPMIRYWFVDSGLMESRSLYFHPFFRLDSFFWGAVFYLAAAKSDTLIKKVSFPLVLLLVSILILYLSGVTINNFWFSVYGYSFVSMVVGILLLYSDMYFKFRNRFLSVKSISKFLTVLENIGKRSYFFYLFHLFVLSGLMYLDKLLYRNGYLNINYWSAFLFCIIILYFASAYSWKYFENPMLEFGKRFYK